MILLDTDVVSYILRGSALGHAYFEQAKGNALAVSFMTAAELYAWAELRHWGERRRAELETLLTDKYEVIDFELGLAKEWARVHAEGVNAGKAIAAQDAWVAATARYHDITLVTHNRKHFQDVAGLKLMPALQEPE